jgi:hypothetical protein
MRAWWLFGLVMAALGGAVVGGLGGYLAFPAAPAPTA